MSDDSYYFADQDAALVARAREAHMAKLRDIPQARRDLAQRERDLALYARMLGISWDDIAAALGTTADAALGQYGEPEPGADPF